MDILADLLHQSCANAAEQIEQQESFRAPLLLHYASEHPDGKHVEEYMLESFVQELVCDELPYMETGGQEEMKPQQFVQVYSVFGHRQSTHPAEDVDDEQIFGYGW